LVQQLAVVGDELTTNMCSLLNSMMQTMLESAVDLQMSYESMATLLTAIDTCGGILGGGSSSMSDLIDMFNRVVGQDMIPGQARSEHVQTWSRLVSDIADVSSTSGISTSSPQTEAEKRSGLVPSRASMTADNSSSGVVAVHMVETSERILSENANVVSNSIRIKFEPSSSSAVSFSSLQFVLQNNRQQDYTVKPGDNFTLVTACATAPSTWGMYNATCPSGHVLHHTCNGSAVTYSSRCPQESFLPSCALRGFAGQDLRCEVIAYTAHNTTCGCFAAAADGRRRLDPSVLRELEVVAVGSYVYDEFTETVLSSDDITIGDLRSSIAIFVMFGSLWYVDATVLTCTVLFLILVFYCQVHPS
jgi:hypothetical protein